MSLNPQVDLSRDHVLGPPDAKMMLVEFGSYACPHCHVVHDVIEGLRSRFGERMQYVFRHAPVPGNDEAMRAAELAEYAAEASGKFWEVHEALMERGPAFASDDFERIARELHLPPRNGTHERELAEAQARVRQDIASASRSGARVTPTFFINGSRYKGNVRHLDNRCGGSRPPLLVVSGPAEDQMKLRSEESNWQTGCNLVSVIGESF